MIDGSADGADKDSPNVPSIWMLITKILYGTQTNLTILYITTRVETGLATGDLSVR
jgi:hypothetical protein